MSNSDDRWPDDPDRLRSIETEPSRTIRVPADALSGTVLDERFRIEQDLTSVGADSGGFGLVYLATDLKLLGRKVVVKILQRNAIANEEVSRKFQHEKEALIRLDHPNIVRILDSGTLSSGDPFIVMEYIAGLSLKRHLEQAGRLAFSEAAGIISPVSRALSAAHAKGIIHRDIKPANIMLSPHDDGGFHVRVIDFGIARVENSKLAPVTMVSRGLGTPAYIAPEQLRGDIELTPAADIYSLTIVIYEMLTGTRPFEPESPVQMYALQQDGVTHPAGTLRSDLPPEADALISKALDFDPAKRPQNMKEFGEAITEALLSGTLRSMPRRPQTGTPTELEFEMPADLAPPDTPSFPVVEPLSPRRPITAHPKFSKVLLLSLMGLVVLAAVAVPAGIAIRNSMSSGSRPSEVVSTGSLDDERVIKPAETAKPESRLGVSMSVQKPNGTTSAITAGGDKLDAKDKFTLIFEAFESGYLFAIAETRLPDGSSQFNFLFPTPVSNGGLAQVAKGDRIETPRNSFDGPSGTETVWLIWKKEDTAELGSIRQNAFDNGGAVKDAALQRWLQNLIREFGSVSRAEMDTAKGQRILNGKDGTIVYPFEIKH